MFEDKDEDLKDKLIYRVGKKCVSADYVECAVLDLVKAGDDPYGVRVDGIALSEGASRFFLNRLMNEGWIVAKDNRYVPRLDVCLSREKLVAFFKERLEPISVDMILGIFRFPIPKKEDRLLSLTYEYADKQLERLVLDGMLSREAPNHYAWVLKP